MRNEKEYTPSCPLPIKDYPNILLAHGSGGTLMNDLIQKVFVPSFSNPHLDAGHDGAVVDIQGTKFAMTTDSYVVKPILFPGGDIGSLAVHGTINDLAMCGAKPLFLTAGFILEEGVPMETLWKVVQSMRRAASEAGVMIVTGDTKVVDRGKGDQIYINTSGVGVIEHSLKIAPDAVAPGDMIILSGDVGRHGIAIMAKREGLEFESVIESDSAPLAKVVEGLIKAKLPVHCLRDLTRGGLATALVEIAQKGGCTIHINENSIPVSDGVRAACEILGLDPLYVANEGRFICFVPKKDSSKALEVIQKHPVGQNAVIIGQVGKEQQGQVTLTNQIGIARIMDMLSGEQLPRIC